MQSLSDIMVTKIHDISTVYSPQHRKLNVINRFAYGLSFCQDGKITYTHNGKDFISDPEHAILLPMGQHYTLFGNETGHFPLINFYCTEEFCSEDFLLFPLQNPESYLKDYERMRHLMLFPQNRCKVMSILYDIFSRLETEALKERDILAPALSFLEEHYMDPDLNNTILASQARISEVYFRRMFKDRYGATPGQYLSEIRLSKAKQLLTSGGLTVTEIAEKSGYASVYHFCRAFKTSTGQTPTEYKNMARKLF